MTQSSDELGLERFDELFVGNPKDIENKLKGLLPRALELENKSTYLQILSQFALAQAMQKKFSEAHETLNQAEAQLGSEDGLARIRILFERGRVFHQSDDIDRALPLFKQSYELCIQHKFDFHAINAAHMIALVEKDAQQKIEWNKVAIEIIKTTTDEKAEAWFGPIYNNLAHSYLEAGRYEEALLCFEDCKKYGETRQDAIIIRGAKWGIGSALRHLGRLEEALLIQKTLLQEYQEIFEKNVLPIELVSAGRGLVYEELFELHLAFGKHYASLAYQDLSNDPWFVKLAAPRLDKMKQFQTNGGKTYVHVH